MKHYNRTRWAERKKLGLNYRGKTGYIYVHDPIAYAEGRKSTRLQHRVVMERVLGRPLAPHENVHHVNGDRTDNRPENLELWSRSQPPGQRVEDKVAWALALLDEYPEIAARLRASRAA